MGLDKSCSLAGRCGTVLAVFATVLTLTACASPPASLSQSGACEQTANDRAKGVGYAGYGPDTQRKAYDWAYQECGQQHAKAVFIIETATAHQPVNN